MRIKTTVLTEQLDSTEWDITVFVYEANRVLYIAKPRIKNSYIYKVVKYRL